MLVRTKRFRGAMPAVLFVGTIFLISVVVRGQSDTIEDVIQDTIGTEEAQDAEAGPSDASAQVQSAATTDDFTGPDLGGSDTANVPISSDSESDPQPPPPSHWEFLPIFPVEEVPVLVPDSAGDGLEGQPDAPEEQATENIVSGIHDASEQPAPAPPTSN